MLSIIDKPIIRRALTRRIESQPGLYLLDIKIVGHRKKITVDLVIHIDDWFSANAGFDLDPEFELSSVINEADNIIESCKEGRREMGVKPLYLKPGTVTPFTRAKSSTGRGRHLRGNQI
jgi:hypothetical protein